MHTGRVGSVARALARLQIPAAVELMEVCGAHTAVLARYGLRQLLPTGRSPC